MAGKGKGFRIFSNILMIVLSLACILPFVLLLSSSVTADSTILKYGYSFLPRDIDLPHTDIYSWAARKSSRLTDSPYW